MSSIYPSSGGTMARSCRNCGTPLAFNESQCLQCGASNLPSQGLQFTAFQAGGQGQGNMQSGHLQAIQPSQEPQFQQSGEGTWPRIVETPVAWNQADNSPPQNNLWSGQVPSSEPGSSRPLQRNLFAPQIDFSDQTQASGPGPSRPLQGGLFAPSADFGGQGQMAGPAPSRPLQTDAFGGQAGFGGQGQMAGPGPANGFVPSPGQFSQNSFFNAPTQSSFRTPSQALQPQVPYGQNNSPQGWYGGPNQDDDEESEKKRPRIGFILLIILMLLVVVGGSFGAFLVLRRHNTPVVATSTPTIIVTPAGKTQFQDDFQNNDAGWDLSQPSGAKVTLAQGQLVLESDDNKIFQEQLPSKTFADFRIDVNAELVQGDPANGYGIYIRGATNQDGTLGQYYSFEVYGDGTFAIYKGIQNPDGTSQRTDIKKDAPASAINSKGRVNHLAVIANGVQMTFIVNGVTIYTFSDNSYKSGAVALFVSNVSGVAKGAQATFKQLAIFDPTEK